MEESLKSNAVNYGLYLAVALSIYTIIGYAVDLGLLVNFWVMLLVIPIGIIIFGIITTAKNKSLNNGYLSFKEAFSSYFITVAIGIMISTLLTVIIFNFIDPEAAIETKNILISNTENMMSGMGAPAEAIAANIEKIENQDTFAIGTQFKSLAQSLIVFAIIGLIVAAAMKKSNPNDE